ncbi:hypothetical protein L6164_003276 [Bauhinia variegata]|uniref:Uncharacterized protein n=1 Tax=Bauhinia variegata TaxID=167791 RepID=A0ACB9Q2B5_BAUVA|nr:hypothetical protein L6164_003276 [Bauhinia variegata]
MTGNIGLHPPNPNLTMANWAELHPDLLQVIAKRLISSEAFPALTAFGGVCTSWRSAWTALKEHHQRMPPQDVWLMLAEEEEEEEEDEDEDREEKCGFFSLSKGNNRYLQLPETMGKQCFSFPEGWVITAAENFEMNLLQPITHVQIKLPRWNTLYRASYLEFPCIILKAGLSANPSRTSDFTVFIVYGTGILAYAKPGDNAWTILRKGLRYFVEAAFYKNKIHGVDVKGRIWVCNNIGDSESESMATMVFRPRIFGKGYSWIDKAYLVESSGKLLVVFRSGVQRHRTHSFQVYELNLSEKSAVQVKDLGDNALFLGNNTSVCVNASKVHGCEGNCIYFTDDCLHQYFCDGCMGLRTGGKDMGVCDLRDGSIKQHFIGESLSNICPPFWVFPNFFP